MTADQQDVLREIAEQLYGYREVVENYEDAKDLLDRCQAMSVAIDALLDGDLPKAVRLLEKHGLRYGE